jgi:hypothetical protein
VFVNLTTPYQLHTLKGEADGIYLVRSTGTSTCQGTAVHRNSVISMLLLVSQVGSECDGRTCKEGVAVHITV